jgi:DNA-directed RNA polymerase specialized sigma24 family protein
MPNVREYPYPPRQIEYLRIANHRHAQTTARSLTDLEVLMQQAPGCLDPRIASIVSTLELKDAVGAIVDALPPEDKYIIEQLLMQGNSLRKLGYVLGIPKTSLARRRDKIRHQLMIELAADPEIQNWIRN